MRIGIVGAGRRGIVHGRAAVKYPGEDVAEVVAVCDPDAQRAEKLAEELGATTFSSHREALDSERLDVMYLTSPPPTHTQQAFDALDAGCHLMIEKPVALDMDSVRRIGEHAKSRHKLIVVCQQHRYGTASDRAKELLEDRKVGLVHSYLYRQKPDIRGNWKREWGGGHIVENQIHPIDLYRYLIGDVTTVFAQYGDHIHRGSEDWDNWDSYAVTLRFASGAVGSIGTSYAAFPKIPQSSAVDIVAEGVTIRYAGTSLQVYYPDGQTESIPSAGDPTVLIGHEFLRAVETGDSSRLRQTYDDASRSLEVCLAANESAMTGKVIRLNHA